MILITGGNGFLGQALIGYFKGRYRQDAKSKQAPPRHGWLHYNYDLPNHSIIWPDPWSPQAGSLYQMACAHNGVEMDDNIIRGDLEDKIKKSFIVIHAAAVANLNESEKDKIKNHRINVEGTINVGRLCAKHKKPLVFISTCCLYGTCLPGARITEDAEPRPTEVYAESKLEAERELMDMAGKTWKLWKRNGLKLSICRMGTMYGPGMRKELFNYMALDAVAKGTYVAVHGTGNQTRQYLYIDDAVSGIGKVMDAEFKGEIYNICGGASISVGTTLEVAMKIVGNRANINYIEDRNGQIEFQNISSHKLEWLGWTRQTSYEMGMRKTFAWMKRAR